MSDDPSQYDDEPKSVLEEAKALKASTDKKPTGANRTRQIVTGAAIGVGSAALVAALLYANRSRKNGKG